jgi:mono/diheme cytochrome c family protein
VPAGALWWKEFYMETDRGVFLMERRIIQRTPDGWAYFTAHAPAQAEPGIPLVLASTSPEAARFMYSAADWLPTRNSTGAAEVHFHDARGIVHSYVFPGQTQCTVCHAGAAGAYPNLADDPIQIFGLHPANLTRTSYDALAERGWITGGGMLHASTRDEIRDDRPLDALTGELVAILRNNCASCHNAAPGAAASFTAFVIDPNRAYSAENLIDLLGADSRMMGEAGYPLVTAGSLEESEIWLRLNGLHGRRRMPPLEGGLPQPDPRMLDLWRAWILAWHRDT